MKNRGWFSFWGSYPTLLSLGALYLEELIPLRNEWERRQHADPNYQLEKHFPLIQSLQGQMPVDLTKELTELRIRQAKSSDWDPEKDGVRLRFLQKIEDFYHRDGKLPFPLLNFCLNNGEAVRELRRSLWKKQAIEGLRPEEVKFLQFLEDSGVEKILD